MSIAKHNLFVSLFLLLVMFANSGFALESISHDNHDHSSNRSTELALPDSGSTYNHQSIPHSPETGDKSPDTSMQLHDSNMDEDCVCDEICGASSIGFITIGMIGLDLSSLNQELNINLYRSISLDLILPPPTA